MTVNKLVVNRNALSVHTRPLPFGIPLQILRGLPDVMYEQLQTIASNE